MVTYQSAKTLWHYIFEIDQTIALSCKPIVETDEQKLIRSYGPLFIATLFEKRKVGIDMRMQRPAQRALQFGHFGKAKAGEILKILAVLKFFAGVENPIRAMTAGNGAIICPRP
jgi:hypothetical protein